MLKSKKRFNHLIVAVTIFSLVLTYFTVPVSKAASIQNAKDLITDSDVSATGVTHTISFTTGVALPNPNGYFDVVFPAAITGLLVGNVTCPTGLNASVVSNSARCTAPTGLVATTTWIRVTGLVNPATAQSLTVQIVSNTSGGVELESADVMIAIIDDVTVSASVSSTLTFVVANLATSTDVNGFLTTGSSTAQHLNFGTLAVGTSSMLGQRLSVATNAQDGYTVTVEQDHNLISDNGADIDSFSNGTPPATSTPIAWTNPTGTLDSEQTYGHFGLTSEDATLPGGDTFADSLYSGFSGTAPLTVMYHTGPADGTTADKGVTDIGYRVQIAALQEAGDYSNSLTYICTPQY
jgi:hypothetical protein